MQARPIHFDSIDVGNVRFKNRLLRSSVGGRSCNWDGTVTDVWKNFEKRFADGGVAGMVSTTFHVNASRLSPAQYPSLATDRHRNLLRRYLPEIQEQGCRYIVQIGDAGYVTYSSLFPEIDDGLSSSGGMDLAFGYTNRRIAMTEQQIQTSIREHADAARRAREAGADGIEITVGKGYLIHQFLNPAINRRTDDWGGNVAARGRFLHEILAAVRAEVGRDYLVGLRFSASDFNGSPALLGIGRLPWSIATDDVKTDAANRLMARHVLNMGGVDYLHVVAGYGFPNPHDVPGAFPFEEIRIFFNSVRHLSDKAWFRASLANLMPRWFGHWLFNHGWDETFRSLDLANWVKQEVSGRNVAVIANGGYETLESLRAGLERCDMVSMARALIANPDLVRAYIAAGRDVEPEDRCSRCNRCVGRTTTSPLGCYDIKRFRGSQRRMIDQIMAWNRPDS